MHQATGDVVATDRVGNGQVQIYGTGGSAQLLGQGGLAHRAWRSDQPYRLRQIGVIGPQAKAGLLKCFKTRVGITPAGPGRKVLNFLDGGKPRLPETVNRVVQYVATPVFK